MKHSQKVLFCENSSSWQWHGLKKFNLQFDLILRKLCSSSVASYGRWNVYRLKCLWANWVWQKILSVTGTEFCSSFQMFRLFLLLEFWVRCGWIWRSKAWNNKKVDEKLQERQRWWEDMFWQRRLSHLIDHPKRLKGKLQQVSHFGWFGDWEIDTL